ncbi:aKG-HExxH-type peptide beta-hydroxylase [Mycobacterium spongiae]|uniref:HEXXH motif domain-containing protein n=1 Tax=Mycobacterium spongiae TaxID=886343 RepID=A0A975PXZ2_9MYCO|nr:HEXXH motif-containing putative peptide modification protein [Mycobacterium spongiae]QUR68263.1 hypothetical protein F6B93_15280 [Mycobacterium spongiae]
MGACESVERALASQKPFGNDLHILDHRRDCLVQLLEELTPRMPAAGELLDAVAHRPDGDHRRLFTETTLRSAIVHAHKQLTPDTPRGPRLLRLTDCAAVFSAAAGYLERGGTDSPLQDGSLVRLGPSTHHGWIWRDEHPDDTYGRVFRELLTERYVMLPSTPDAGTIDMLTAGARLLDELLPSLAPSTLHHAHIVACVPTSKAFFGSSSRPDLSGTVLLRESLGSPWWVAEHLLHESVHMKLYDLLDGDTLMRSDGRYVQRPVVTPWNPSLLSGANRWHAWRVLAAFHVYVHLTLLSMVAERRAPELETTYGAPSGIVESHRARTRAHYLGHQLRAQPMCWNELGPFGQELADWLQSHLDTLQDALDPAPAPDGSTLHLYLDRYHRETDRVEQLLSERSEHPEAAREQLTALARQDVASARAILGDLGAHRQLDGLDTALAGLVGAELADHYPEIRRTVETWLLDASPDGYRLSASGTHDAMVGQMVDEASDALYALATNIPAPVAHAKRRAVEHRTTRSCRDNVGRLLAVQAAHVRPGAQMLDLGAGVGIATAWLVAGLGSRTDVAILSVETDETLSAAAHTYPWPPYVRIETSEVDAALAGNPGTFDLILVDARAGLPVDAIVAASRPGGMLIFDYTAVTARARAVGDTDTEALRRSVLDHEKLVVADIDASGGVVIAAKRA